MDIELVNQLNPHDGGPCPVDPDCVVRVLFAGKGQRLSKPRPAKHWQADPSIGLDDLWQRNPHRATIIVYVVEPTP